MKTHEFQFIHQFIEKIAGLYGEREALVCGGESVRYSELNSRANGLAGILITESPNSAFVAISTHRSIEMVIGILAALKAGKAFIPIDPEYPLERINKIIKDSGVECCVSKKEHGDIFQKLGLNVFESSQNQNTENGLPVELNSNAYVIYTSGSTGEPKGVVVEHKSIINYIFGVLDAYLDFNSGNSGSYLPLSLSFDASMTAIFATLLAGKRLVISSTVPMEVFNDINFVKCAPYDFIKLTPTQFTLLENASDEKAVFGTSKYVVGGEALYPWHFKFLKNKGIDAEIINEYGPTEATVGCISFRFHIQEEVPVLTNGLPIGKAMPGCLIYILNSELKPAEPGQEGEIYVGGIQVAHGYLNRALLTEERFLPDPFAPVGGKMYKTGDLARQLPNGVIEYLGRNDEQVKIRGNRIETGEIEAALSSIPDIKGVVVIAREDTPGEKLLVAYLTGNPETHTVGSLRQILTKHVPDYMIPAHFIWMANFPLTVNGKVDKRNLPPVTTKRPALGTLYKKPASSEELMVADVWKEILHIDKIGLNDNFFELGGTSILVQKMLGTLKNRHGLSVHVTQVYRKPTIAGLVSLLQNKNSVKPKVSDSRKSIEKKPAEVAVIGMAGRFPGADTIEALWDNLKNGKETIRFFSESELDPVIPESLRNDPDYVKARGIMNGAEEFDPEFFGINYRLAELMDPQQRKFLEVSWELLEKTAHLPGKYNGRTGVFAGSGDNSYYLNNVHWNKKHVDRFGLFQVKTYNEKDYIASRTAYQLDLKGPAVSVYSACSTSLLAIALAVESIRKGQCEIAIAGGSYVTSPINSGHLYQEGAILSKDGHCRAFDANASGTVFSDGCAAVLLKNLDEALKDGDTVYAVIKGIGVNNDGGGKGSFTAPSSEGQAESIRMAIEDSGIHPETIGYVETHGTATPLGDPIEIEGLKLAFGETDKKQFCPIGSIKSNMGHLTSAAGAAGLIKTVLALHHQLIPPSIGFENANPNIDFTNSPFYVNSKLQEWKSETVRRAGVSSFGVGGTNVHVILEEFQNVKREYSPENEWKLFTWSAKTESSRDHYAIKLASFLEANDGINLSNASYTLQKSRAEFTYRRYAVAQNAKEFISLLEKKGQASETNVLKAEPEELVFLFPGQGAQFLNMGRGLYDKEPLYKAAIDECSEILKQHLELDIREIIFPVRADKSAEEKLKNTRYTQPAIFITAYAVAKLWISYGLQPGMYCGHSIGEFVGAHLAGVFNLQDALKLIAIRGKMVSELPHGSMLSVRSAHDLIEEILPAKLSVAAVNSNKFCVVAGEDEDIADFARILDEKEIPNKVLLTSHAFHSAMMDPIVEQFREVVNSIKLNVPTGTVISTVTGKRMTDEEATDPAYWARHLRQTVRFADASDTILLNDNVVCLECGPGTVTSTLIRQQSNGRKMGIISSLENNPEQDDRVSILKAMGQLWNWGISPDWDAVYRNQKRIVIDLPTYAFETKRCWLDPVDLTQELRPSKSIDQKLMREVKDESTVLTNLQKLRKQVREAVEEASGIELNEESDDSSFIELGLDSLLLTQMAVTFKKMFELPVTFRQLNMELTSISLLAGWLEKNINENYFQVEKPVPSTFSESSGNSSGEETLNSLSSIESLPDYFSVAPVEGAKLGQDEQGCPAWYLPDINRPGKYALINLANSELNGTNTKVNGI